MRQLIGSVLKAASGGKIHALAPTASVADAVSEMNRHNIGAVLVLDEQQRLRGIFTERDVLRRVIDSHKDYASTPLESVMTDQVVTLSPQDSVEGALRLVTEHNCRHLPVVDGKQVLGMISIRDLTTALVAERDSHIAQLTDYIAGGYGGYGRSGS